MAAAIKSEFDVEPKLIQGSGGVFDVKGNDRLVYSKHETGRFPDDQEVLDALHRLAR